MSGSRLAVGSSRSKTSGLLIRDLASETLFFCPEDSSPVFLYKKSFKFNSSEISSILCFKFLTPYNLP